MIKIDIPGDGKLELEHLVLDVNGTLALDGQLLPEVSTLLSALRDQLIIHLLTADTHGKQAEIDRELGLTAVRVKPGKEAAQKAAYVRELGSDHTGAIGQGANDALMLAEARLGICILSLEGTSVDTLLSADLAVPDIQSALNLILHPARLIASLRY
jgi:P-type E1-E2 ATPase